MARPDRTFEVGFLGAGYIADWHASALRGTRGARLAAICDRDESRARALASRHGARAYTSLGEMLVGSRLDAIHILLPPEAHAAAAAEAIEAGVHVLLEKPMVTRAEDADALIDRARAKGVTVGIGHNFLFTPAYARLRDDLRAGRLGRPLEASIVWNKPLPQLQAGPFDLWMLREPGNILLEIGPHSVAHLLDLLGPIELVGVHATNPVDLPGGRPFFRRWRVEAGDGPVSASLGFSFAPGFSEHTIHVRGSLAAATVDFERDTYVLQQHTPYGMDFDRYHMTVDEAGSLRRQARAVLRRSVLSKVTKSPGTPYGRSIAGAMRAFYEGIASGSGPDRRLSPELGRDVVQTCAEIIERSGVGVSATPPPPAATPAPPPSGAPEVLVLGATGFIGQELTRQLLERGHAVRVLVRSPGRLPDDLRGRVEVVVGDLSRGEGLDQALAGIRVVYHLARPHVKTWEEYAEHEVAATRRLAEACLTSGVGRLIYTGTIDSYYSAARAGTITEETPLDPHMDWRNYYARAKALSEQALMDLHRERGLPVAIFRPGIVIGRGTSPMHWGVGMWSWDAICQMWGPGETPLPLVLVEDVASALVSAMETPGIEGESFNLIADTGITAREYLAAMDRAAGVEFRKIPTPPWRFFAADLLKWVVKRAIRHPDRRRPSLRDWESRTHSARYDCSKARTRLAWEPTDAPAEVIRRGIEEPARELFV